ncbi:MAG: hypothetical protein AAFY29_01795 [Pseudomonadota bacterium]
MLTTLGSTSATASLLFSVDLSDDDFSLMGTIELAEGTEGTLTAFEFADALVALDLTAIGRNNGVVFPEAFFDAPDDYFPSTIESWLVSASEIRLTVPGSAIVSFFRDGDGTELNAGQSFATAEDVLQISYVDVAIGEEFQAEFSFNVDGGVLATRAAVSSPGSVLLLLSGLGGLCLARRTREPDRKEGSSYS